jgi:hypothetical protein
VLSLRGNTGIHVEERCLDEELLGIARERDDFFDVPALTPARVAGLAALMLAGNEFALVQVETNWALPPPRRALSCCRG